MQTGPMDREGAFAEPPKTPPRRGTDVVSIGPEPLPEGGTPNAVALVLDAHQKSALAAIRSLGRRGIPVIAASHRSTAMGLYSRYVRHRFLYPSPLRDRPGFTAQIKRQTQGSDPAVLFAFSDSTFLPLADARSEGRWILPRPSADSLQIAFDKARTLQLAASLEIATPATYSDTKAHDFAAFLKECHFPVVVKPRRSVSWHHGPGTHSTPKFATSLSESKALCAELLAVTGEFPLVQEYVYGEQASVQFLCDRGAILATCANRRLRSSHPCGGPGALKQTVPFSYHGIGERAQHLVSALNWSGPIMVEFKIDAVSGEPKLMEINGRFWGSLPLAVFAGVDFPYLYYRVALGIETQPVLDYDVGLTSRHLLGDLRHLYQVLLSRDPMRSVSYPPRWQAIQQFLITGRRCKSDVAAARDPVPAVAEILDAASAVFSRIFR